MSRFESHLSDQQLLLELEGELPRQEAEMAQTHLRNCGRCRARQAELRQAMADFSRLHETRLEEQLPLAEAPRARLQARLSPPPKARAWLPAPLAILAAVACVVVVAGPLFLSSVRPILRSFGQTATVIPNPRLTPGATLLVSTQELCAHASPNNKTVPVALQRRVFEQYGIRNAEPRSYEVDYLITPALGGADDIHNLWPHSYSPLWNAWVKDALEDRLRDLVCEGSLDLRQAQQDIATNWIEAYKKYFHTDRPLREHQAPGSSRRDF